MARAGRVLAVLVLYLSALGAAPATAGQGASADISVVQSIHHDGRFSDPGPLYDGPPKIPDEIWFVYDIFNDGPNAATVRWRVHHAGFEYKSSGRGRYDFWSVPMHRTTTWIQGDGNCTNYSCRVRVPSGQSYRIMLWAEANAPGPFSIYATVTSPDTTDPDSGNNRTATWDKRVACKIVGTDRADRLVATDAPDSICGRGGRDHLVGVGNDDKIFGQKGNDVLVRRPGNRQTYVGGPGRDTISLVKMGKAVVVSLRDRTAGGATAISLEKAIGSRFDDYLTGLIGRDWLYGGPGDDRIAGRGGRDVATGGKGNDRFITADGAFDVVRGGPGDDVCQADSGDNVDSATRVSYAPFYLDP